MKMKKQFLGILLSLVMVLGLMPGMSMMAQAATAYTSGQIRISDMANGDIIRGTCTIYQNPNRALEIYDTDGTTLLQQYNNGSSRTLSALGYDTIVTKTGVGSGDYNNRLVKLQKLSPSPTVTSVTLDKNELSLDAGGATAELIATVEANYDAIKGVTWSSSDSTVATVNSNGVITPVGAGDPVTIKATSTWDNTKYAECVVTVNASHTHSFTYAVDGATITATCTADGCTLPESSAGVGDHVATLTISANGGTYDGTTAYGATITDANSIQSDAKVQYQKKTDGSYGTATETAPTDAGTYKASITVGGETASVEYTIAQAATSITENPTVGEITYGQTLADSTLTGGTASKEGRFEWKDSTVAPAVSDSQTTEYDVVFTPTDGNYGPAECKVKLTVNKADSSVAQPPTAKTLTYNGQAQELVTAGTATGGEMWYALGNATEATQPYTTTIPTETDAGTYYVWYMVHGDKNHIDSEPACVKVTIEEEKKDEKEETDDKGEVDEKEETDKKDETDTSIETEVNIADGAPAVKVDNLNNELAVKLLTDEEKAEYEGGTPVQVYLDVKALDKASVPAADLTAIEKKISDDGYTYGECLDLSLWKKVGDSTAVQIHDTNGNPISVTIPIPDTLKNVPAGYTRTFSIVRVHHGAMSVLGEGTGNSITIKTDGFSSYFIIFKDVKNATDDKKQDSPKVDAPKKDTAKAPATGDKINIGMIVMLMIDCVMAGVYLTLRRRMEK